MTDHGEDLCEALLAAEVLPVICSTLDGSHDQIVLLSLAFCNAILSNTSSVRIFLVMFCVASLAMKGHKLCGSFIYLR